MPALDAVLEVVRTLLAVGIIGLAAFGMGRPVLRALKIPAEAPLPCAVWSLALGLVVSGVILLALGWVGWLYEPAVAAMSLAGCLSALVELACSYLGAVAPRVQVVDSLPAVPPSIARARPNRMLCVLAGFLLLASLIAALAPPTSPAVLSRLEIPKNALLNHAVHSAFHPAGNAMNLVQTWFVWALALDGPVAVNVLHWSLGLLAALATMILARGFLGTNTSLVAACLVLAAPGVQYQMAVPLEDLALALFTALALSAACQVVVQLETAHWPLAAGLALGAGVAVNPAGLLVAAAVAAIWVHAAVTNAEVRAQLTQAGRTAVLGTITVAGPWLVAAGPGGALRHPQSVQSALAHVGPLLLAAAWGWVFVRRLRGLSTILGWFAAYLAIALVVRPESTWWAPAVPPLALLAAWVLHEMIRLPRPALAVAASALAVLAVVGAVPGWSNAARSLAVASGYERRGEFLTRYEPSYRAASLVNRLIGPDDRLFCQDTGTFYFDCFATNDRDPRQSFPWDSGGDAPRLLVDWAKRAGFAYVLLSEPLAAASNDQLLPDAPSSDGPVGLEPEGELGPIDQVIPILEYRFADDNNRCIRYRLLRLH